VDDEPRETGVFARWWEVNRARLTIFAIAALAGGGIVCMIVIVLVLIARQ
jgi:hypothetical protein